MPSKNPRTENRAPAKQQRTHELSADGFQIAAIGASAGGIEAFGELIRHLPTDTGMAFILIQHLDPTHHSILTELVAKETAMPVVEASDGLAVEPNHVYVIPPNASMTISGRALKIAPREETRGLHMSIDHFMRSLAGDEGSSAVGVILSGLGSDGTLGVGEIQAQGGVTFAQEPGSAKYDSMPRNAIAAGGVDYVLPPKGIARELARIARHPYAAGKTLDGEEYSDGDAAGLHTIFQLLRRNTGVDFTHYRKTTILRRIQRRMMMHKIDQLDEYVKHVHLYPGEIKALCQDMLINVTSFFRNPRLFDALKKDVFPAILNNRLTDAPIRVWTPGCSSGEETYSITIALLEFLGDRVHQIPLQFFGTDVSESSIAKARSGVYPENIQGDVSAERLRRFFTKAESGYRISKSIRDVCIFAQHNLLSDPPFSQMDLICCRNVMIYLEPILQSKVVSLFHYALRIGGFLALGTSEGLGSAAGLFTPQDRTLKIFSKKVSAVRQLVTFSLNPYQERGEYGPVRVPHKQPDTTWNYLEAQKEFDRRLLSQYAPATVFINEDLEIIHSRGQINRYLKLAPGRASLSIMKMAREGLLLDLRSAIAKAKKENSTVQKQNVPVKNGNGHENAKTGAASRTEPIRRVNIEVSPIRIGNLKELYFMILFQEATSEARAKPSRLTVARARERESKRASAGAAELEQELAATKGYLQSVIETQETTNEELQSANEEILSSNEELQSTNEELETAKEELQSANEELSTVNDELRSRNAEITQINNDLTNLLSSIDVPVVMVGSDLTIRRFTPRAQEVMGLIPADVGRPFLNINPSIEIPDLQQMVVQVIANSLEIEKEVRDRAGNRFHLRILPYRTAENKAEGAVVTLAGYFAVVK
jgi:two-component system CheB/CheR fusion protein